MAGKVMALIIATLLSWALVLMCPRVAAATFGFGLAMLAADMRGMLPS